MHFPEVDCKETVSEIYGHKYNIYGSFSCEEMIIT